MGMLNVTNVTMENITSLVNVTQPTHIFMAVNEIFGGNLYFILLILAWVIMFVVAQENEGDTPFINLMTTGVIITISSFILRVVYVVELGVRKGLITDKMLWIFPIITAILIIVNMSSNKN